MYFDKEAMKRLVLISFVTFTLFTSALAETIRSDGSITQANTPQNTISSAQAGKREKIVKPTVTPSASVAPVVIVPAGQPSPKPVSPSGR